MQHGKPNRNDSVEGILGLNDSHYVGRRSRDLSNRNPKFLWNWHKLTNGFCGLVSSDNIDNHSAIIPDIAQRKFHSLVIINERKFQVSDCRLVHIVTT